MKREGVVDVEVVIYPRPEWEVGFTIRKGRIILAICEEGECEANE